MEFQSVNKLLENSFKKNWDLPALSNYQGVTLCYRDVARRIARLHIAFEQCGLKKGNKQKRGDMKTPSPALCIVRGAGWWYRNGLDTECPDSVGFTIW